MNTEKKGLHPLAWVAIGCGALVVIVGLVLTLGLGYLGFKAKQFVQEYEDNPAMGVAKVIAATNPEIEIDSSDETAETVTFRNTKTGETFTINYKDLEEGRVSFESSEGSFEIDSSNGEGGTVTMRDETGKTVFEGGAGSEADPPPTWVPRFAGDSLNGSYTTSTNEGNTGTYQLGFPADTNVQDVLDFYETSLQVAGFQVDRTEQSVNGQLSGTIRSENAESGRTVTIIVSQSEGGVIEGVLNFTEEPAN